MEDANLQLTFVVGTGRCGSTLLHRILAKHPDAGFLSRAEEAGRRLAFLSAWANSLYRLEHKPGFRGFARRFLPTEAYSLIDRQVSPIYSRPFRDLTGADVTPWLERRFREFFESRFKRDGQVTMVHKYTGWSRIGFFARIFPEARFVHVVRDGRAVANSWLQMPWWNGYRGPEHWQWGVLSPARQALWDASGRSHVLLAALCWDTLIESYEAARPSLAPERYMMVRYEDLVEDPERHCREIVEFANLPWTRGFEREFARFEIRKSRVAAFQRDLDAGQQDLVESAIRPALQRLGYLAPRGIVPIGGSHRGLGG